MKPIIPGVVIQVAAHVIGNDAAITFGDQKGHFELNTMQALIAHNLLQSIWILGESALVFTQKCIRGIEVDEDRWAAYVDQSLAISTDLIPMLGYGKAAELSKKAHRTGKSIREVVVEDGLLPLERSITFFPHSAERPAAMRAVKPRPRICRGIALATTDNVKRKFLNLQTIFHDANLNGQKMENLIGIFNVLYSLSQ